MRRIYPCPYNNSVECHRRPCAERCGVCGHNPIEAARRRGYIEAGGMTKLSGGMHCLRVEKTAAPM